MVGNSKVVAVTGASSGIGEATARRLAAAGHRVVLGARRMERLSALAGEIAAAGGDAYAVRLDVADLASMRAFVDAALARHGRLDVMVNHAGVMPLHGIAAVLPVMQRQGSGHFVNLSSIGGHRVSPAGAVYSATKFAVRAISDGLRQETDVIRVTVVSPGVTASELASTITDPFARDRMEAFRSVAIPTVSDRCRHLDGSMSKQMLARCKRTTATS